MYFRLRVFNKLFFTDIKKVNQEFQIDIHPGAKFGEGVFIDHGTGIVVGETTVVGNDVSMLHRVTLGGSGVQNADRHPKVGRPGVCAWDV